MVAVRMVQVAIDQVIDVIAVRNGLVPAIGTVNVSRRVRLAGMLDAAVRILRGNIQRVFLNRAVRRMMVHVSIVQVIDVIAVLHGRMAAVRTMLMVVLLVSVSHDISPVGKDHYLRS